MTKNVIAAIVGSVCAMFLWESHSLAQGAVSGTSLNITGPASISGSTTLSSLVVTGAADLWGNSLYFGTSVISGSLSASGMSLLYTDGTTSRLSLHATRPSHEWLWERSTSISGTAAIPMMKLDANHVLTIYDTAGNSAIVLDPEGATSSITLNGQQIATVGASSNPIFGSVQTSSITGDGSGLSNLSVNQFIDLSNAQVGYASYASNAGNADWAGGAGSAGSAGYASTAESATYSSYADSALRNFNDFFSWVNLWNSVGDLGSSAMPVGNIYASGANINGDATVYGKLTLSGSNSSGVSLAYDDGVDGVNSSITLQSTRPSSVWNWQRLTASGTSSKIAMQLDASNRLILTGTADANPPQLVLDPNGAISLGGSNLLTQAAANSLYLSATAGLVASNGNIGIGTATPAAKLEIDISSSSTVGQIVKSASSQTAALQQWQDSAGNTLAEITSAGGLKFINGTTTVGSIDKNGSFRFTGGFPGSFMLGGDVNNFTLTPNVRKLARIVGPGYSDPNRAVTILGYDNGNGYADLWFGGVPNGSANAASTVHFATSNSNETVNGANIIDRLSVDNAGQVLINGFNASAVGLTVKGGTAQTGDLQRWQNSAGTVLGEITASGNFGIGTVAPANQLHVESQTNGQGIVINKNTLVEGDYSSLLFGTTNTPSAYLGAGIFLKRTGPGVGDFILANRGSAGIATPSDAVITINSAGNLGIGTTTPQAKLDVNGSANVSGTLAISGSGALKLPDGTVLSGSNTLRSVLASGTISNLTLSGTTKILGGLDVGSASVNGSSLITQTDADTRYFSATAGLSAANGNIGIGTDSPQSMLDVVGSASFANGATTIDASGNGYFAGRVGIGTTNPSAQLEVYSSTSSAYASFNFAGDAPGDFGSNAMGLSFTNDWYTEGALSVLAGTYPGAGLLQGDQIALWSLGQNGLLFMTRSPLEMGTPLRGNGDQAGPIVFATGGCVSECERMRITPGGNIGIGTSTPQAKLDVVGDAKISGNLALSGTTTVTGGLVISGTAVTSGTATKIVASGSNQLVLIPEQGDLSMGDFTHGSQPPQQ